MSPSRLEVWRLIVVVGEDIVIPYVPVVDVVFYVEAFKDHLCEILMRVIGCVNIM